MTVHTITTPRRFDLTFENCETYGIQPLYAGATWSLLFRAKDDAGDYIELASGSIVRFWIWDEAAGTELERDSETAIAGEGVSEIEILSDQATTNKGRYRVWFRPSETVLDAFIATGKYQKRRLNYASELELADGTIYTPHFSGKIDIGKTP